MKRMMFLSALGLAAFALPAPVQAQAAGWLDQYRPSYSDLRQSYYDSRRVAYDNGFREGVKEGEKDGKKREVYRFEDEKAWQHADKGYRREYGDVERYRQAFRSGYVEGYTQSYRQYAPNYGNNGPYIDGRAVPRHDGYYPAYPNGRQYP